MAAKAGKSKSIPLRMGFAYIPNGVILPQWRTTGEGRKYNLPASLRSLEPFKSDIQALDGLDHRKPMPTEMVAVIMLEPTPLF